MSVEFSSNLRIDPQIRRVTASILDRLALIDDGQKKQLDEYDGKALRADVRRSLEALLNTRRPIGTLPLELKELASSVYHYGIPDITHIDFGAIEQMRAVCQNVETTIKHFEPRLLGVRVKLLEQNEYHRDRILRFRIRAKLQARPRPEEVIYDSIVHPVTNDFEVWTS